MHDFFEETVAEDVQKRMPFELYARWLIEQGDPLGDFIRLGLQFEDGDTRDEIVAIGRQQVDALEMHQEQWLGSLAPFFRGGEIFIGPWIGVEKGSSLIMFERGLPAHLRTHELSLSFRAALSAWPRAKFLKTMKIDNANGALLPSPDRQLRYRDQIWRNLEFQTDFRNLRQLHLGSPERAQHFDFGDRLGAVLADGAFLQDVAIYGCRPGMVNFYLSEQSYLKKLLLYGDAPEALLSFAANESFSNLEELHFLPTMRPYEGIDKLVTVLESMHLKKIKQLSLTGFGHGDELVDALIRNHWPRQLRQLNLHNNDISPVGLERLAEARRLIPGFHFSL